ncbi:hypothetical protein CGRA01v4_00113 [Colletotrichum graminicola]|uniref:UVI-1 protein n=1 Tax=Colletotrichum graminicola (strain M1.001 / M2 / FGSC 10212) TaxID=645133 RepID=E3QUC0_COLGM|nr:uncharacterized protein GLRG_09602 [Colletotrichum graminicola M1.001]EFQ34458.1 hypothetical protein GLRG_09602 [Colletotrichum graminicola M1.001]WDK08835.1 hypothetical protein CGRA01v4_00113 [Colletotrichum graminicola]
MQFTMLKYAVVALATHGSGVLSQLTPANVVTNLNTLTAKSRALQAPAKDITLVNGPLILIGQGPFPAIIQGFTDIVSTTTNAITSMQGMAPVSAGADSDSIFNAFRDFVRVHQALLNILIGKAGLLNTVPFAGQPIAAVLRQVEAVVDTVAFTLIDMVQSRAADLTAEANSLDQSLDTAIKSYQGVTQGAV